tara:strand:- start:218 stop:940 length:723 start_codon:yes stop_codon:yes gene_type:complete
MPTVETVLVTVFSTVSIILHAIHLADYHPGDTYSVIVIASTGSLFILPWAKKLFFGVGEWLFIAASLLSLISQGLTFGKYHDTDAYYILLISLLFSILGAFTGHYIREGRSIKHGNTLINKFKTLFLTLPVLVYFLNAKIHPIPITFPMLSIVSFFCILIYNLVTYLFITRNKYEIGRSSSMTQEVIVYNRKSITLLVSAIPLSTFSIYVGEDSSVVNIVMLILFIIAIVLEHVNALYFD